MSESLRMNTLTYKVQQGFIINIQWKWFNVNIRNIFQILKEFEMIYT